MSHGNTSRFQVGSLLSTDKALEGRFRAGGELIRRAGRGPQNTCGKLQIVKPFEVGPGETLTFVFDITVVERGQTGEYNLLPVISESGVAGKDVQAREVDDATTEGNDDGEETTVAEETEREEGDTEESENDAGDRGG